MKQSSSIDQHIVNARPVVFGILQAHYSTGCQIEILLRNFGNATRRGINMFSITVEFPIIRKGVEC